VKESSHSV